MSQKTQYLERVKRLERKIIKEDSPKRKKRLETILTEVKCCIKNIEQYGSPKKPDGIPVSVRIGIPG